MNFWNRVNPTTFFLLVFAFIIEMTMLIASVCGSQFMHDNPGILLLMPAAVFMYGFGKWIAQ